MKRKRHTPQEIIAKLREAEVDLHQGATIEAVLFVFSTFGSKEVYFVAMVSG